MAKHTPGPWQVGSRHGNVMTEVADINYDRAVAAVWTHEFPADSKGTRRHETVEWPEGLANAKLIAAAPVLLQTCKQAHDALVAISLAAGWDDDLRFQISSALHNCRQIIAKAEGQK